jgi:hypothetical protein
MSFLVRTAQGASLIRNHLNSSRRHVPVRFFSVKELSDQDAVTDFRELNSKSVLYFTANWCGRKCIREIWLLMIWNESSYRVLLLEAAEHFGRHGSSLKIWVAVYSHHSFSLKLAHTLTALISL